MIEFKEGNIFDSSCEALVNPVNCVGVMGAGLALQFKNKYPNMFLKYKKVCDQGLLEPGKIQIVKEDKIIINFPTKRHWKEDSDFHFIELGLNKVYEAAIRKGIKSIAFPKIGAGLGNLEWEIVRDMILNRFENAQNLKIEIYE